MVDRKRSVTIIMYHYVRDPGPYPYSGLHAISNADFKDQIRRLVSQYSVISMQELLASVLNKTPLPDRSVVLTFDDGYTDHLVNVLPVLQQFGVSGAFFPSVVSARREKVLDVNKIQLVLSCVDDHEKLRDQIFDTIDSYRSSMEFLANDILYRNLGSMSRFDNQDTTFVKRALQFGLPQSIRDELIARFVSEYLVSSEEEIASDLYMSEDDLGHLLDAGMFVGCHGNNHVWMDTLSASEQEADVDESLRFLNQIGASYKEWVMCYPYGASNDSLLEILQNRGCCLGLTVNPGVANLRTDNPLLLPRLDTNDSNQFLE